MSDFKTSTGILRDNKCDVSMLNIKNKANIWFKMLSTFK